MLNKSIMGDTMKQHYENIKQLIVDKEMDNNYNITNMVDIIIISSKINNVLYNRIIDLVVNYCNLHNLFYYVEDNQIKIKEYS